MRERNGGKEGGSEKGCRDKECLRVGGVRRRKMRWRQILKEGWNTREKWQRRKGGDIYKATTTS